MVHWFTDHEHLHIYWWIMWCIRFVHFWNLPSQHLFIDWLLQDSLIHCFIDSLFHFFTESSTQWRMQWLLQYWIQFVAQFVAHYFIHWLLVPWFIRPIANGFFMWSICPFAGAPRNFNNSLFLPHQNLPIVIVEWFLWPLFFYVFLPFICPKFPPHHRPRRI